MAHRAIEWVRTKGSYSFMVGSSLFQREVRRDFSRRERSFPAPNLFPAALAGHQSVAPSLPAALDPGSAAHRILLVCAPSVESRPVPPQSNRRRVEIDDVVTNGFLPIELHAQDLFSPQALP